MSVKHGGSLLQYMRSSNSPPDIRLYALAGTILRGNPDLLPVFVPGNLQSRPIYEGHMRERDKEREGES